MKFLTRIQKLPERKRRIILWLIVIIVGLALFSFWVRNFQQKIKIFEKEKFKQELQLPSLQEKLKEIPKIEMPKISEEELKELEEKLKEIEKQPE